MNKLISATAMALLLAAPTQAAPFTLFIYEDQSQLDLRPGTDSASQAYWASHDAFGKDLAAAGVLRGGSALNTGGSVALVTASQGRGRFVCLCPFALGAWRLFPDRRAQRS